VDVVFRPDASAALAKPLKVEDFWAGEVVLKGIPLGSVMREEKREGTALGLPLDTQLIDAVVADQHITTGLSETPTTAPAPTSAPARSTRVR
jgi:hypothetical protein